MLATETTTYVRCDECRRSVTLAEIPSLFKRGFSEGGITITMDLFLCKRCHRKLTPSARIHWMPLEQLFDA